MYQIKRLATKLERKGSAYVVRLCIISRETRKWNWLLKVMLDFQNYFELILSSDIGFGVCGVFVARMLIKLADKYGDSSQNVWMAWS